MQSLYPLRFKEILKDYGFGGRWIPEAFEKTGLPKEGIIAETWEVCCRPGEASHITNGIFSGTTIAELIESRGEELLGSQITARFGLRFPLLIKFLDVTRTLAEQVHPDDAVAARFGLKDPGKTEAWYILRVRGRATIRCGNLDGMTAQDVGKAMRTGTAPACMREYAVRPGDSFLLYGGTTHYSEGGILLYEIMQNSAAHVSLRRIPDNLADTEKAAAIRRAEQAIHIEDGADFRSEPVEMREGINRRTLIFACAHFCLERLDLAGPFPLNCDGRRFCVLTEIDGTTQVRHRNGVETLHPGNSCLMPASLGETHLLPEGSSSLLKAYVPDLVGDLIEPLRKAGIADDRIVLLGARTEMNPLRDLVRKTP